MAKKKLRNPDGINLSVFKKSTITKMIKIQDIFDRAAKEQGKPVQ